MEHILPQLGIMNAMRTGNVVLDMVIAISIPLALTWFREQCHWLGPLIVNFILRTRQTDERYTRIIEYEKTDGVKMNVDDGSHEAQHRNRILQEAITLYVGQLGLKYNNALMSLNAVGEKAACTKFARNMVQMQPRASTSKRLKSYTIGSTPPLDNWVEVDHAVFFRQVSGVESKGGPNGGPKTMMPITRKTSFMFKCAEEDGDVRIEAFIQKTFDWYCKAVESTEDHFRYLYSLVLTDLPSTFPAGMVGAEQPISKRSYYKRFQLSDAKDFFSLFFPEKDAILRLLEHFENKTGKYAIKGYPHKLGLLLHGPPGTGKTSLIKALACRTGRNVVSVPLTRIRTNQELMDIVFDQKFQVVGEGGLPVSLGFRDVIFVMEDVDVTSPIVKSRDPSRPKRGTATTLKEVRPLVDVAQTPATVAAAPESGSALHLGPRCLLEQPVQLTRSTSHPVERRPMKSGAAVKTAPLPIRLTTVGSTDSNVNDDGDQESSHPPRNSHNKITSGNGDGGCSVNHPTSPERVCGLEGRQAGSGSRTSDTKVAPIMRCSGTSLHSDGSTDGGADETSMRYVAGGCRRGDARGTKKGPIYGSFASTADNLDLAGLLNVLDGVVDTPGRIVVMTTNYPEALDAALIRPGRIDKIIYLGHMRYPAALEMTLHYFQVDKLEPAQDQRLRKVFGESSGPEGGGSARGDSHGGCRNTGKGFYDRFTPATVEQMASEHETVDEFLSALEARAMLLP